MPRYTVHVPKLETNPQNALERAVFVREGWSWGAFIFGPLWLLWNRHYAFGLIVLVLYGLLLGGVDALPLHQTATALAHLLISFLFGLEGVSLRRFALSKAGYAEVALMAGDGLDEIERRFFAGSGALMPPVLPSLSGVPRVSSSGVIGLFPEARLK